jgi:hypothetical protein
MQEINNEFGFDTKPVHLVSTLSAENPNCNIQTAECREVGCLKTKTTDCLREGRGISDTSLNA